MNGSATINDLPDELLLFVFDCLDTQQTKIAAIAPSFNILRVLSCVCRRFRRILAKRVGRDLRYRDIRKWSQACGKFGRDRCSYLPSAKSITIGHVEHGHYDRLGKWEVESTDLFKVFGRTLPVHRLTAFECVEPMFNSQALHLLKRVYNSLNSLTLVWNDSNKFPPLQRLHHLQRLRLYVRKGAGRLPDLSPCTYHSLTHLTIHNINLFDIPGRIALHCLCDVTFPQLKVFNIQKLLVGDPVDVFDFVHRHPTLLEVNVHLPCSSMRVGSILKLIDGTGTWRYPSPDEMKAYKIPKDVVVDFIDPRGRDISGKPQSLADLKALSVAVDRFAFTRRPLHVEATGWRKPVGSERPRYTCTSLALLADMGPPNHTLYLPDFLDTLARNMPHLEEVRIWSQLDQGQDLDVYMEFTDFMASIADALRQLVHLRRLTLLWPIRPESWRSSNDWIWNRYSDEDDISHIGSVYPPCIRRGKSIDEYESQHGLDSELIEATREAVSRALRTSFEQLDRRDPYLLTRAWEVKHEITVAKTIRLLAETCPSLQQINWYPDELGEDELVLWSWNIHRRRDRSVRLVNGDLTWTGCARGNPPPFVVLEGEELEEFHRNASGIYNPEIYDDEACIVSESELDD